MAMAKGRGINKMPEEKEKVLVAEDNDIIRKILTSLLSSYSEYEVYAAKDGEEAVQKIKELNPGIVITDLEMPRKNGDYVIEKAKEHYPLMHIVLMTAKDLDDQGDELLQRAFRAGPSYILRKPFTADDVERALKSGLQMMF
jgi:CheY-like chemotaxis protein